MVSFAVFSVSSCNSTETHMISYMVEVGPWGDCHLNGMAVVGAVTVVVAAAANRSRCMHLLVFGGSIHIYIYKYEVARGLTSLVNCLSRKSTAKSIKA